MGRNKIKRLYKIKPECKRFAPADKKTTDTIELLHEEYEAIFLMDFQELYQEDAAKEMGVSRPTFSRIIKNARKKVAVALIQGVTLTIKDEMNEYKIAFCSDEKEGYISTSPKGKYIKILTIQDLDIVKENVLDNPSSSEEGKPGQVIPKLLKENGVNAFVATNSGEGLKSTLLINGITFYNKNVKSKEEILKLGD